MKKTLTEQYRLIKDDKGHKGVFLKEAKKLFPNLIRQGATYNEASKILKQKNIITENFVGMSPINNPFEVKKKEGYESAFENFLKEATEVKAEEKKVSKEVEEDQSRGYDNADKKDPNNMIFGQIQMGYYCELKNPKNTDKTDQELLDIVHKNLEKDPIFYTKNGQFGEEGVGYTDEAVSLGIPVEPKGEYKSSGYGTLKENKLLNEMDIHALPPYGSPGKMSRMGKAKAVLKKEGHSPEEIKAIIDKVMFTPKMDELVAKYEAKINEDMDSLPSDLKEHSIALAGGIVTGGGFVGMNYMDYYGLNEEETNEATDQEVKNEEEILKLKQKQASLSLEENDLEEDMQDVGGDVPTHIEAVADAVEMAYDAGMSTEEIIEFIEQHLGGKYGDY